MKKLPREVGAVYEEDAVGRVWPAKFKITNFGLKNPSH